MFAIPKCGELAFGAAVFWLLCMTALSSWLSHRVGSKNDTVGYNSAGWLLGMCQLLICSWLLSFGASWLFHLLGVEWLAYELWSRACCWLTGGSLFALIFGGIVLQAKYWIEREWGIGSKISTTLVLGFFALGSMLVSGHNLAEAVETSVEIREAVISNVVDNYQVIDGEQSTISLTLHFDDNLPRLIVPLEARDICTRGAKIRLRITTACGKSPKALWLH